MSRYILPSVACVGIAAGAYAVYRYQTTNNATTATTSTSESASSSSSKQAPITDDGGSAPVHAVAPAVSSGVTSSCSLAVRLIRRTNDTIPLPRMPFGTS